MAGMDEGDDGRRWAEMLTDSLRVAASLEEKVAELELQVKYPQALIHAAEQELLRQRRFLAEMRAFIALAQRMAGPRAATARRWAAGRTPVPVPPPLPPESGDPSPVEPPGGAPEVVSAKRKPPTLSAEERERRRQRMKGLWRRRRAAADGSTPE